MTSKGLTTAFAGLCLIAAGNVQGFDMDAPEIYIEDDPVLVITAVKTSKTGEMDIANTILCQLHMHYPHNSHHVPGTVNAQATASCSVPVPLISLDVGIVRNDVVLGANNFFNSNVDTLQGNAATPCVPGMYRGVAIVNITFPPGYNPPTATGNGLSSARPITC